MLSEAGWQAMIVSSSGPQAVRNSARFKVMRTSPVGFGWKVAVAK
jgi:hypothetical protein